MYKIAIVEDEWESAENLTECFEKYTEEYGVEFNITHFKNGFNFLDEYTPDYDIVFMDVDMPKMNGLNTAKKLRAIDTSVVLVFVTFLAKYAINGYEVGALDYVLKPVNYNTFKIKIDRAIGSCASKAREEALLPTLGGTMRIELYKLNYIEISNHDIVYHTQDGEIRAYGTMRAIEKLLPEKQFCKCNRCYLVNLRNVTRIDGGTVSVGGDILAVSRPRRQAFLDALHEYSISYKSGGRRGSGSSKG